jgi:hypothetical protein
MNQSRNDVDRIHALLDEAASLVQQKRVALRCDTDSLETVYVEARGEDIVIHDHGATFLYLAPGTDATYRAWSAEEAAAECARFDVALIDIGDEDTAGYMIERRVTAEDVLTTVVESVDSAIDAVFRRHLREDLQEVSGASS